MIFDRKLCIIALLLAGCGDDKPPPVVVHPPPSPAIWQFQYSPGMSTAASYGNGGFTFLFPQANGAHYLVMGRSGALSQGLSISYDITTMGAPVFDYRTADNNTCGPGYPGTATLYFMTGNDWYGEFGRWFASGYAQNLEGGAFTINAPIDAPDKWVSVYGKKGNDPAAVAGWQAAINNVSAVGLTFGGGCFAGHGVFVTGGSATMTATSFAAN